MSLVRIDWSPTNKKIRQFGGLLSLFALVFGLLLAHRHRPAAPYFLAIGIPLGLAVAALPRLLGLWIYKIWMGFAFVMGTITSFLLLAVMYYGILTPLAVLMRLRGRDALRLKRPSGDTCWVSLDTPDDIAYYERLF